ncbi:ChaN family lipoprotein [Aestuariicoccus sp. MJ-SS9]|uniref:ChaN family lipoprotein n=1 Tax=Aestuariicoccus sp. MJ-SS9 TaxID=3079855 RepID=UPI00290D4E3B|nr:ChaN family lipoprotein [Aestuariicoccus sp. MJ-SS9]MDU8909651.1 ChaN family lipoprotein [Aestuariicoccus sp. MJ-SS9]
MRFFFALFVLIAPAAYADGGDLPSADVLFLGEQHDNPAHHARQAAIVADVRPAALVFEMLTPDQAGRVTSGLLADQQALETTLGWRDSGWPDFAMYYPIFTAAPGARIYGAAVPRERARAVMSDGILAVFGDDADAYGLSDPLPADQQATREALQLEAHCDAMPEEMLPMMVDIQRLRDARLAQEALRALQDTGGPVAVITGNGHARLDWGAPAALSRVAPGVSLFALGQGEEARAPDGSFDRVETTAGVDRGDPCAAFR